VRSAFAQRRKTLRNSLKTGFEAEQIAAAEDVIDLQRRAETLDLLEFSKLAAVLH
jgi:16S rRNA A1518/A1519 N6-dimethyltransferase RsmA/KsgA/DIM1 with predicted DNA glycosylase/AP lyase activity